MTQLRCLRKISKELMRIKLLNIKVFISSSKLIFLDIHNKKYFRKQGRTTGGRAIRVENQSISPGRSVITPQQVIQLNTLEGIAISTSSITVKSRIMQPSMYPPTQAHFQ